MKIYRQQCHLSLVGEAEGVKNEGGILEVVANEIEIRCRPSKLPSAIELDISNLGLGENLQIKDLPEIDGVAYVSGEDTILVSCVGSASGRSGSGEDDDAEEDAESTDTLNLIRIAVPVTASLQNNSKHYAKCLAVL